MWIALAIIAFIALVITVILLLPVHVIIKNNEQNELLLRYTFLFRTYGENPNPNDPLIKTLKRLSGVNRIEKKALEKNIESEGLWKTFSESKEILLDLIREIVGLLKYCTAKKIDVHIRCAGDDAAQTAILYGRYTAAVHGLLNALRSLLKIRRRGCNIDIGCDFFGQSDFRYDILLRVRFGRVLAAYWRVAMKEARRLAAEEKKPQQK